MTTETTTEVVEAAETGVDAFFTKLTEVTTQLTDKLISVAPDIADALLNLVQAHSVFNLIVGFLMLTIPACIVFLKWHSLWAWVEKKEDDAGIDASGMYGLLGLFCVVVMGGTSLMGLLKLLSFTNWIGAFYPEGALALKALEAAGLSL